MDDKLSFKLQTFEGPLDLLLHLIKKNKVSVYDIPIVEITEQYLDYLSKMEEFDLEISSEFLYMASELLLIKSKMLLPRHEEEEEDPRQNLADRLIEYEKIKKAKEKLEKMQDKTVEAVIEGFDKYAEVYFGRTKADAPDIDGKIFVMSKKTLKMGEYVNVHITDSMDYDLIGEVAE